jgi:predicted secreted protein
MSHVIGGVAEVTAWRAGRAASRQRRGAARRRMRRRRLAPAMLVLALLAAACGGAGEPARLVLRDADAGSTVQVARGSEVDVRLRGNPSTGYAWQIVTLDASILQPDGDVEFAAETDAPGAGGIVTLHFKAAARGQTHLELAYRPTYDPGASPAATFAVVVIVT